MKRIILVPLAFKLASTFVLISLAGCYSPVPHKILDAKSTVLGIEVTPGGSSAASPAFRIGLVRQSYRSIPTSTNDIHSAPFSTTVDADVKGTGTVVREVLSTR